MELPSDFEWEDERYQYRARVKLLEEKEDFEYSYYIYYDELEEAVKRHTQQTHKAFDFFLKIRVVDGKVGEKQDIQVSVAVFAKGESPRLPKPLIVQTPVGYHYVQFAHSVYREGLAYLTASPATLDRELEAVSTGLAGRAYACFEILLSEGSRPSETVSTAVTAHFYFAKCLSGFRIEPMPPAVEGGGMIKTIQENMSNTGKSIKTIYKYKNGNATFKVAVTTKQGYLSAYDFHCLAEEFPGLIGSIIKSYQEPVSVNRMGYDVQVASQLLGTQKLYMTYYRVEIELETVQFPEGEAPDDLSYKEFDLAEKRIVSRYRDFRYR